MRGNKSSLLSLVALAALITGPAFASEGVEHGKAAFVGAVAGLANPTCTGCDARFAYGVAAGYRLMEGFELGTEFTTSAEALEAEADLRQSALVLEGNFEPKVMGGIHLGPRVGIVFENESFDEDTGLESESDSFFSAGAQIGYDYLIGDRFSVGLQADWSRVFADDAYSDMNFLVPLKVWF